MRLWVDTDVGWDPDDAVALLCADAHPDVDLVGVSTVDDADGRRAEVARALVEVPVVRADGLASEDVRTVDAVLAIGPLTNVAGLLGGGYEPPRLAVMGGARGAVRHRGAVRTVEHNFGSDPAAAAVVLARRPNVLICPLDVTMRTRLSKGERERLVGAQPALEPMVEEWIARQRQAGVPQDERIVCLHDPLTLLALLGDPVVRVARAHLSVDSAGELRDDPAGPEHAVAVDVDATTAKARILALLEQRSR